MAARHIAISGKDPNPQSAYVAMTSDLGCDIRITTDDIKLYFQYVTLIHQIDKNNVVS